MCATKLACTFLQGVSLLLSHVLLCCARLELIVLAKKKRREETSKVKILRIKKREYRDDIKSKETRLGWGEAHNARKVSQRRLKPICAHRLHHTSPILPHTCCI